MLRVALIVVGGTGVGCSYSPGTFAYGGHAFPGTRATVGCLDVAIERRADYVDGSVILGYRFANRCTKKATIDLGQVRVIGRDAAGAEHELKPFDPSLELRPLPLDARLAGKEVLSYPADGAMEQVCVDAGSLARDRQAERWLCFARLVVPEDPSDALAPSGRFEPSKQVLE